MANSITFADLYDESRRAIDITQTSLEFHPPFVCADRSIFAGKPVSAVDENCIHQVYVGPIASIGFAPWPWFGLYAKYSGTDIDLGVSLKPFKSDPMDHFPRGFESDQRRQPNPGSIL